MVKPVFWELTIDPGGERLGPPDKEAQTVVMGRLWRVLPAIIALSSVLITGGQGTRAAAFQQASRVPAAIRHQPVGAGTVLACGGSTMTVGGLGIACSGQGASFLSITVSEPTCVGVTCILNLRATGLKGAGGSSLVAGATITRTSASAATAMVLVGSSGGVKEPVVITFGAAPDGGASIAEISAAQGASDAASVRVRFTPPPIAAAVSLACNRSVVRVPHLSYICTTAADPSLVDVSLLPQTCIGGTCSQPVTVAVSPQALGATGQAATVISIDVHIDRHGNWVISVDISWGDAVYPVDITVTSRGAGVRLTGESNSQISPIQAMSVASFSWRGVAAE